MYKMKKTKINSLLALIIAALVLSTLSGTQFVTKVNAATYTETVGTLDGAQYVARFPDPWNGILVVVCRGFSHLPVPDVRTSSIYPSASNALLSQGYAVAASSYGAGGYCIQKGMNTTYQLTKYLINTYNVTGKVFLIGASMGGGIALLLGEKYPNVYSGVLDLAGAKDSKASYETRTRWANLSDADLTAELSALSAPVPPYQFANLTQLKNFCATNAADIVLEAGGTPASSSKAYEDISPTYHANISIPVITVQGTSDALMPLSQTFAYQAAVEKAGRSSLYRLYTITGAQHVDPSITAAISPRFAELVKWSSIIQEGWTLINDARTVKASSDLREYVWQKNASMTPNGQYDKIGLHRLVKTGTTPKGVVFVLPGLFGSGEKLISNPPNDNFTMTENYSQPLYWANRGFDVYSIDYRTHFIPSNFNASQLSFIADWGLEQFFSDIKESVDKAKDVSGVKKMFMAGQSMGGNWAQYYAAQYGQDDLRGIILLDPSGRTTLAKNLVQTNTYNLTAEINKMNNYGNWSWENPQQTYTPSPLNPGYLFLAQFVAQNPNAPAQYLNGTLITTINPRTNMTWTNITEWFEYSMNSGKSTNTYGGYGNMTVVMQGAAKADRYMTVRPFFDSAAMQDWTVSPYLTFDFMAHIKEINVPVLGFRSGLYGVPNLGNLTNGMATTDFTSIVLPNYGHSDVFQGTYSARDVSQPTLDWMLSRYQSPVALASSQNPSVTTGQTATVTASVSGGVSPYTFQWYEGTNAIPGQTSAALAVTKISPGTYTYYCNIQDAEKATVDSNTVTLSVALAPTPTPTPTARPSTTIIPTPTPTVPPPTTEPTTTPTPTQSPIPQPSTALSPEATYGIVVLVAIIIVASATLLIRKRRK